MYITLYKATTRRYGSYESWSRYIGVVSIAVLYYAVNTPNSKLIRILTSIGFKTGSKWVTVLPSLRSYFGCKSSLFFYFLYKSCLTSAWQSSWSNLNSISIRSYGYRHSIFWISSNHKSLSVLVHYIACWVFQHIFISKTCRSHTYSNETLLIAGYIGKVYYFTWKWIGKYIKIEVFLTVVILVWHTQAEMTLCVGNKSIVVMYIFPSAII